MAAPSHFRPEEVRCQSESFIAGTSGQVLASLFVHRLTETDAKETAVRCCCGVLMDHSGTDSAAATLGANICIYGCSLYENAWMFLFCDIRDTTLHSFQWTILFIRQFFIVCVPFASQREVKKVLSDWYDFH